MKNTLRHTSSKGNYDVPKIKIIRFASADIITASDENQGEWDEQQID